jgi:hypothetical protein
MSDEEQRKNALNVQPNPISDAQWNMLPTTANAALPGLKFPINDMQPDLLNQARAQLDAGGPANLGAIWIWNTTAGQYISDGRHRTVAALQAGITALPAKIYPSPKTPSPLASMKDLKKVANVSDESGGKDH